MATGTVKFFNHSRGFGFIEPEDGGKDVFVHVTAIEQAGISSLEEGDKVEYEIKQDERSGKSSAGRPQEGLTPRPTCSRPGGPAPGPVSP